MAAPRLTRSEQRERTRDALLDAAGRVFVERGFAGASVEAIAADAGYTRGAFYSNFASKEELFAELLQRRAFDAYRAIVRESGERQGGMPAREIGERAAAVQAQQGSRWLFGLWLEVLAHAGRDAGMRAQAAEFWRATRAMGTEQISRVFAEAGREPPVAPREIASAMIALDLGLALQRYVDPEQVPLDAYGDLYDLLFGAVHRESQP
jgi:AcrR family transcriptional regulator